MADEAPVKDEEAAAIEDIAEEVTQEIAAATTLSNLRQKTEDQ